MSIHSTTTDRVASLSVQLATAALLLGLAATSGCSNIASQAANVEGVRLYQQGNYQQATDRFQQAIAQDPKSPEGYYNLAASLHKTGTLYNRPSDLQQAENTQCKAAGIEELQAIHERKTGALFVAALELGGLVAGASAYQLAALQGYGQRVGLAFQITDDLLDVAGEQLAVGKRVAKDDKNGKLTFPAMLGVEESRHRAAELIDEACDIIEVLGPTAKPLVSLARFVTSRQR